jgi:hypothetical protein
LRKLIDKALNRGYVLLPLAAPHHRRDGLVCFRPSTGQEAKALSGGGRRNTGTYEKPRIPATISSRWPDRRERRKRIVGATSGIA